MSRFPEDRFARERYDKWLTTPPDDEDEKELEDGICEDCEGKGIIEYDEEDSFGYIHEATSKCKKCHGSGLDN